VWAHRCAIQPRATDPTLLQEDRTSFLDALQWTGEPSARLGRSDKKRRRTGRTATGCERQSSSQDGAWQISVIRTSQPNLPRIPEAWRTTKLAQIGSRTVTYRFGQTKPREMPMKSLISRAMYHPLIALSIFYLTDLMHHVDYSLSGALLVLAAKSMSRVVSLFNKG
jgi:hypothetical protein